MLGADSLERSRAYQSLGFVHVFVRLSRLTRAVGLGSLGSEDNGWLQ